MAAEAPPLPRHRPPVRAALPLPSTPVAGQTIQAPLMARAARRAADPAEQALPPWQVLLITAPARWVWFRSAPLSSPPRLPGPPVGMLLCGRLPCFSVSLTRLASETTMLTPLLIPDQGGLRNRDFLREPPPREWLEAQEQRGAEAELRRVQRMQQELRLIERIRAKGETARRQHQQVHSVCVGGSGQRRGPSMGQRTGNHAWGRGCIGQTHH